MFTAKILNGFGMARMGRYVVEHSPDDDRIIVYVSTDGGGTVRVYVESDGSVTTEMAGGNPYDDRPLDDEDNTSEVLIGQNQDGQWESQ